MTGSDARQRKLESGIRQLNCLSADDGLAPAAVADALMVYVEQLAKWNRAYNLTAVRDPDEMVTLHLLDSLVAAPWLRGERILDVGTGAGLPGVPLAVCNPDREFVLLDSNGKKTRFVQHVTGELGLENVAVRHSRVESFEDTTGFDTIISRAFASVRDFVGTAGHLVASGGCLVAMKGRLPEDELERLPDGWAVRDTQRLEVPGLEAERHVVVLEPFTP